MRMLLFSCIGFSHYAFMNRASHQLVLVLVYKRSLIMIIYRFTDNKHSRFAGFIDPVALINWYIRPRSVCLPAGFKETCDAQLLVTFVLDVMFLCDGCCPQWAIMYSEKEGIRHMLAMIASGCLPTPHNGHAHL